MAKIIYYLSQNYIFYLKATNDNLTNVIIVLTHSLLYYIYDDMIYNDVYEIIYDI